MMPNGPPYSPHPARIEKVRGHPTLNGLAFLEVEYAGENGRAFLCLHFVNPISADLAARLKPASVHVDLPDRPDARLVTTDLKAADLKTLADARPGGPRTNQFVVGLDAAGAKQVFTLRLTEPDADEPLVGIDPWLSAIDFSFLTDFEVDVDVVAPPPVESPSFADPSANYLARDFDTFIRLMYDRLALSLPGWRERHTPDLMVTLIELLAYVADYLAYYQDGVATEAYLQTARHRISVRRHARLVDYRLSEGCSPRVWVCLETDADVALRHRLTFVARTGDEAVTTGDGPQSPTQFVFESIGDDPIELRVAANRLAFYDGGGARRELPAGTTTATLLRPAGPLPLRPGDAAVIEWTGGAHVVRLLTVSERPADSLTEDRLFQIEWSASDALATPVPLVGACVRGNVVLANGGKTTTEADVTVLTPADAPLPAFARPGGWCRLEGRSLAWTVPYPDPAAAARFQARLLRGLQAMRRQDAAERHRRSPGRQWVRRFRRSVVARARRGLFLSDAVIQSLQRHYESTVESGNSTIYDAVRRRHSSAYAATHFLPVDALPDIRLIDQSNGEVWTGRADLLNSSPTDRHFVVEVDDDGGFWLQFGDGSLGRSPKPGQTFSAEFRTSGLLRPVGPGDIGTVDLRPEDKATGITLRAWNPLPAFGGRAPESTADAKRLAPDAYRSVLERAVVPADYAELATQITGVAEASAAVDYRAGFDHVRVAILPEARMSTAAMRADLVEEVADRLARSRRIGHELTVVQVRRVPLELVLAVDVVGGRSRTEVERDVAAALSSTRLPDGRTGYFHLDNLSNRRTLAASELQAVVQQVSGVRAVSLLRLRRLDEAVTGVPPALRFGPDEMPQLENDERHPGRGQLVFVSPDVGGGVV